VKPWKLASSSPSELEGSQGPKMGETQRGVEEDDELVGMAKRDEM
jgi:hypothetical protein